MKILVCEKETPWEDARDAWFHRYRGNTFEVIEVHPTPRRLYEVDVNDLIERGEVETTRAFIPEQFAEAL